MISDLLHLFFPNYCLSCATALYKHETLLCTKCHLHLPFTGYHEWPDNPVAKMFHGRVQVEHASAMLHFHKGESVQKLMHALKYKGQREVGVLLGRWVGYRLKEAQECPPIDAVIPVPMHSKKKRKRGYNQCDFIAKGAAEALGVPKLPKALRKTVDTSSQTRKARFTRWKNVETVFQLPDPAPLEGKHLLLVDDVVTTGATLEACVNVLQEAKGARVSIATVACA